MKIASHLTTFFGLCLGLGLAFGLSGSGCVVQSIFTCAEDQNCIDELGLEAVCESNSQCTQLDMTCDSGKRWHERAVEELAGECFEPGDLGGSGSATGQGSSGESSGSGSGGEGTTTLPESDSSGDPPPMTDEGSSGGGLQSCTERFGTATGYELCEETAATCAFNVLLDQNSCDDACMAFDSTCVTAFNNSAGDCASAGVEAPCAEQATDQICVCTR